jgi:nitrite reductase/ring-hydroxylating ferredoxin subunit
MQNKACCFFVILCSILFTGCVSDTVTESDASISGSPKAAASNAMLSTATSVAEPSQASSAAPAGIFIAAVSDVPQGSAYYFKYSGSDAVLMKVGGEYRAFTRECTHAGCALSLDGGVLKCPCHGSQFDASTGAVLKGPAKEPLTPIPVLVVEDNIYVVS